MFVRGLLAWLIVWMMGRSASSVWSAPGTETTIGDYVEMQNEERRRLVEHVDGEVEEGKEV